MCSHAGLCTTPANFKKKKNMDFHIKYPENWIGRCISYTSKVKALSKSVHAGSSLSQGMHGRRWNSGGTQDIKSNSMSHLSTPNLFPRARIQLISSLVVESTRQRVEHLRIVPHYQIPPILWNRRWKFLKTWKSYIVNESYLLRGRYLMTHKAVKCKSMAKFVDDIWLKIPEWIQQIRHAHTIYTQRA